jgi:hypothetical protein
MTRPMVSAVAGAVAAIIANASANAADMVPAYKAPAPAAQQVSGYVEVFGGWASLRIRETICDPGCDSFSDRFNGWVLGGAGRANYWLNPNISMQLDAQAEGTSYRTSGGPFSTTISQHSFLIGGHINRRDPQRGLVGVFVGGGDAGGAFGPAQRHVVAGAEAQLYWNQFTLYVQGGYDTVLGSAYYGEPNAWFVRGTGRYFVTPNTMVEGTVLYANGEIRYDNSFFSGVSSRGFQTWLWEAKLEHRFATTPFAAFLKYRGSDTNYDDWLFSYDLKATDHRVLLGLRLFMGQDTLRSNDRNGATLDIIDPLGIPTRLPFSGPA